MTKDLLAAQRYARALFEIARELHQDEWVEAELESFSASLRTSPEIEKFFANPALKSEDKGRFLQRLYSERSNPAFQMLLNFFAVLFEKHRFYLIHDIALSFKKIADEAQGQGTVEIRSAAVLKPEAEKQIVGRLERLSGNKITVKNVVDPSLIGGVLVRMNNKIIDDSVKSKIQSIKKELTKIQSI